MFSNRPGELSEKARIQPPELALELAKQEIRQPAKERFEAGLLARIVLADIETRHENLEAWKKKIAAYGPALEGPCLKKLMTPNGLICLLPGLLKNRLKRGPSKIWKI